MEQLIPALTHELEKLKGMMGKSKYLCEMFSILQAVKDIPSDKMIDWDSVVEKLQSLAQAQAWLANKITRSTPHPSWPCSNLGANVRSRLRLPRT